MDKKLKILFTKDMTRSFISRDITTLKKHFDVEVIDFKFNVRDLKGSLLSIYKIFKGVLWADLTFSWFAGRHAHAAVQLSKIFRKKSIVVIGGYEVANEPEIEYGAMLNPKSARMVKYILANADKILAVSEYSKKDILKYTNSNKIELVYNSVDFHEFKPNGAKENLVITVGYVVNHALRRKRYDIFVKSAKYLPNIKFVLIGEFIDDSIEYLRSIAPPNVEFTGFISDKELLKYYQKAKVNCQLSIYESFGVALAEGMLCGCIPIVTNCAALPEVVGDAGFYVPYGDEKATAEAIKNAFNSDKGKEARERVKNMFSLEKREAKLVEIIKNLHDPLEYPRA